ncbi:MAG: hypothetical protein ACYTGZ_18610 [Planctomycetota bacterium]
MIAWILNAKSGGKSMSVEQGARKIRGTLAALYRSPHEFASFSFDEFPLLDESFYDETEDALTRMGFRFLHDIRDVTVSEATGMPQCGRVMSDPHGTARVGIFHIRVGGWQRMIAPISGVPRDIFAVEFLTELEDGCFMMTNNAAEAPAGTPLPDTWAVEKHPASIGLEDLYARHLDRVRAAGVLPRRIHREEDVLASYDRQWEQAAAFWRNRNGRLTHDEFVEVAGKDSRLVRKVHEELDRIS